MRHPGLKLSAVVFDFDGTLALLNIDFREMRRDVLGLAASFGIPEDGMERLFVLEMIAETRERIARKAPGREDIFYERALKLVIDRELAGAVNSALFPGIREMLSALRHRGIRTGILTRNCTEAVTAIFPDIRGYSDAVVTRNDTERVKPHPDHLLTVLRILDEKPENAAMVGDHPIDIHLGRRTGTYTIGVLSGHSRREDLLEAEPDLIVSSAPEILRRLSRPPGRLPSDAS